MTEGTSNPITVDSISLDTYAWNIDGKIRGWAGMRDSDEVLPGIDGDVHSLSDDYTSTIYELSMWVQGSDAAGVIPSGTAELDKLRSNLDELSFIFRKRHALIDLREIATVAGAVERQAFCKCVEMIKPELRRGRLARFIVMLKIPSGVWQDVATSDWATTPTVVSGNFYEVTTLQGSSAPINDAIVLVTGPVNSPRVTDFRTGAWVQLNRNLSASEKWRVNCDTWATQYGTTLTLASLDTDGTSGDGITDSGGGNNRLLKLEPSLITSARRVQVSLTGTAITSATAVAIRARKKFFQ